MQGSQPLAGSNQKKIIMEKLKVKEGHVLIMKTVNEDMSSHHDSSFIYPKSGYVEAVDFVANDKCGNGIHGFLRGEGYGSLARFNKSKWIILSVIEADVIMLDGKVKFRNGEVVYTGSQQEVTSLMKSIYPNAKVIGGTATTGYKGTATAGYKGTATAGDKGIIIILHWNCEIYIRKCAVVGENGIKPNVAYTLDSNGNFVEKY